MSTERRRRGRTVKIVLAAVSLVFTAFLLFGGALVRGPVLRGAAHRYSERICGTVRVSGGHVSWYALAAVALGRPIEVELRDLEVTAPDGRAAVRMARVYAVAQAQWRARRIVVDTLVLQDGFWHPASEAPGRPAGFIQAFRPLPPDGDQSACAAPSPKTPPRGDAGRGPRWSASFPSIAIERFDLDFSYPVWGLRLLDTSARGQIAIPGPGGVPLLFAAENVHAAGGGSLRIGPRDKPGVPVTPFDEVSIIRVAVEPDHPKDLVLEVGAGRTGRARLSGEAVFLNLFDPEAGPGGAGMRLRATWTAIGDALGPALRDVGIGLPDRPYGWGNLELALAGPFGRLSGRMALVAPDAHLAVEVEDSRRVVLQARLSGFETAPWLTPRWEAFRGRIDGRLSARLTAGKSPAGLRANLDGAAIDYRRTMRPRGGARSPAGGLGRVPARIRVRVGAHVSDRAPIGPRDALVRIERADLRGGVLSLSRLQARAPGLSLRASGRVRVLTGATDAQRARDDITVDIRRAWLDLERLLPHHAVRGAVAFAGRAAGSIDRLSLTLDRHEGSLELGDRRVTPVGPIRLVREGDTVEIRRLRLQVTPGGVVTAHGRLEASGAVDLTVGAERFAFLDLMAPAARRRAAGAGLQGRFDALLSVRGRLTRPAIDGWLLLTAVRLGDRPLGDGGLKVTTLPRSGGYRLRGGLLGGALRTDTTFRMDGQRGVRGTIEIARFPLSAALPLPARQLDPDLSGEIRFDLAEDQPPAVAATVEILGRGLAGSARGRLDGDTIDARVSGVWDSALRLPAVELAGRVEAAGRISGTRGDPRVEGRLDVRHATAWIANQTVSHLRGTGTIEVDGIREAIALSTTGFEVALGSRVTPASGTVRVGRPDAPARVRLRSLDPPRIDSIFAPLAGRHVSYAPTHGKLEIEDLSFNLVVSKQEGERPILRGEVAIEGMSVEPLARSPSRRRSSARQVGELARQLELDVVVRGPDAVVVKLPLLPDPTIGFACRVQGTAASPSPTGLVRGAGLYSRALVGLYDLFADREIRRCGAF